MIDTALCVCRLLAYGKEADPEGPVVIKGIAMKERCEAGGLCYTYRKREGSMGLEVREMAVQGWKL